MNMVFAVAAGGALGATARYFVGVGVARWIPGGFPWATLTVNIAGALAMGVLIGLFAHVWSPGRVVQAFLTVGVLGGLTTFSSFSLDVVVLIERGQVLPAASYVLASVIVCVVAVFAGLAVTRMLFA